MSGRRDVVVLAVVGFLLVATIVGELAIADARRAFDHEKAAPVTQDPCGPQADPFAAQRDCAPPPVVTTTRVS